MPVSTDSNTVTDGIRVIARPRFEPDHSEPAEDRYVFSYKVTITNESDRRVQVVARQWLIINGEGDREEVTGPGVVGFTPTLAPGESFRYTSYCPLDTDFGTMEGTFQLRGAEGRDFEVEIGRFYLVVSPAPASPQG